MSVNGVIVSKLNTINEYLYRLRQYLPISYEKFENDWGLQKISERSLQVMVEAIIDITSRIISKNKLPPADTSSKAIVKLKELGVIKDSTKYAKMVRFRNLIVHDYASIDIKILYDILTNNLTDFEKFTQEIKEYENI